MLETRGKVQVYEINDADVDGLKETSWMARI